MGIIHHEGHKEHEVHEKIQETAASDRSAAVLADPVGKHSRTSSPPIFWVPQNEKWPLFTTRNTKNTMVRKPMTCVDNTRPWMESHLGAMTLMNTQPE